MGYGQDLSLELPSHDRLASSGPSLDLLTAGPSLMADAGESSISWDTNLGSHGHLHHHHDHHRHYRYGLETFYRDQEVPVGKVTQRGPVVALIEVQRNGEAETVEDESSRARKKILRVQPAPDHVCLAFDPLE